MTMGDRVAVLNAGRDRAVRHAPRPLRPAGQPVRRRVHRLAVDELLHAPRSNVATGGSPPSPATSVMPLDPPTWSPTSSAWVGATITVGVRAESITASPVHEAVAAAHRHGRVRRGAGIGGRSCTPRSRGSARRSRSTSARSPPWRRPRDHRPALSNLVTKLPAHASCRPGDIVTLYIDPANVHCFDPAGPSLRKGARQ